MKAQKLCIILLFVSFLTVSVISDDDVETDDKDLELSTDLSTESSSTFGKTEAQSTVESDSKTVTQNNEETTTYGTDDEEFETEPPKGLLGQVLMDGPDIKQLPPNASPEKVYSYLSKIISDKFQNEYEKVIPDVHDYFFLLQELVSQSCFTALMRFAQRAQKHQPRVFQMLDASAKIITNGLTEGTYADLGNFEQCIKKDDSVLEESDKPLNGRYCLIKVKPPLPVPRPSLRYSDKILNFTNTELENGTLDYFLSSAHGLYPHSYTMGLCFVSECEAHDIKSLLNNSLHKYKFGVEVGTDCYTEEVIEYNLKYIFGKLDFGSWFSIIVILVLSTIIGLATVFEFFYNVFSDKNTKESEKPSIICFSLISNVKNLYSLKTNSDELTSLNGIKVMAMLWVVVANVYFLGFQPQIRALIKNLNLEMSRRGSCLPFQLILNSWHASEIFFLIGGLLKGYTITIHLNRNNGNFSLVQLIKYFSKRLLRFLPPIVFPILLTFLMPLYPNGGPLYKSSTSALRETCSQNWWKSLLFINNWIDPSKACLPHLWFVSAYIQLSLIAIFVLIVAYKSPKLLYGITVILVLIGITFPMYMTATKNLSAKSVFMDRPLLQQIPEDLKNKHFFAFNHLSIYFIGLLVGVNLCSEKSKKSMNIFIQLGLWLGLPAISLLSVFITFLWNDLKSEPSLSLSIVFNGFSRIFFISGIAWIINECVNKRAGLVDKILSNKQLLPLSRLIYQIYLLNLFVIWFYFFTKRDLIIYRDIELLLISAGIFVATVVFSIFGYLVFEAPFVRLSNRVFNTSDEVFKRELRSLMSEKQSEFQLRSIEINGNTIIDEKIVNDQDANVKL